MIKKNLFKFFKRIGTSTLTDKQKSDLVFSDKIDGLLKSNKLEDVILHMESGYYLNSMQQEEFNNQLKNLPVGKALDILNSLVDKNSGSSGGLIFRKHIKNTEILIAINLLNKMLKSGQTVSDEVLVDNFINFVSLFPNPYDINVFNNDSQHLELHQEYLNKFKDKDFNNKVFNEWINHIEIVCEQYKASKVQKQKVKSVKEHQLNEHNYSYFCHNIGNPIEKAGNLFLNQLNNVEINKTSELIEVLINACKHYEKINDSYSSTPSGQAKRVFKLFNKIILEQSQEKESIVVIQADVKNLPDKAQEIVNNITTSHYYLMKNKDELAPQKMFDINNIWNKRIPEIISKYLNLDEEYRDLLKNNMNKTGTDLLIESLTDIKEIFNEIKNQQNIINSAMKSNVNHKVKI